MIVWINGAFGAGKTHTAHELQRRLGTGHVADPELLGFAIHKMLPPQARADFQDRPQWRTALVETVAQADAAIGDGGPVLVPMTVVDPGYFDETVGALRRLGADVRHYTLVASPQTLALRLSMRAGSVAARVLNREETWAEQQIPRCTRALAAPVFATHVDTDQRSLDEVVEVIAADLSLPLPNARLSPLRAGVRRAEVAARHLRF